MTEPVPFLRGEQEFGDLALAVEETDLWTEQPVMWAQGFGEFGEGEKDAVNVRNAVLFSLVLPGAGQWYAGAKRRAAIFLATDAVAWTMYGYFKTVEGIKERDHQRYAEIHAGVNPSGKDDTFYRTITFHDSRDEYNADRSTFQAALPRTSEWDWHWDSPESRAEYRTLRNQSNEAGNRAKFTLGGLLFNRLVAAVDSWRTARRINRQARMDMGWRINIKGKPSIDDPKLKLIFSKRF